MRRDEGKSPEGCDGCGGGVVVVDLTITGSFTRRETRRT